MKYTLILIVSGMLLFGAACSETTTSEGGGETETVDNDPWTKVTALNDEVMDIHDSSMVKMDAIYDRISALREIEKGVDPDGANENNAVRESVLEAIGRLQKADDAMMDWMRYYQPPEKEAPVDSTMAYLEKQKESIISVDVQIDESLNYADEILEQNRK